MQRGQKEVKMRETLARDRGRGVAEDKQENGWSREREKGRVCLRYGGSKY